MRTVRILLSEVEEIVKVRNFYIINCRFLFVTYFLID